MFGEIIDGRMKLNDAGLMVRKWWVELKNKFSVIELDDYIIMPNHFHGTIIITSDNRRDEVISPLSSPHVPDTMRNQGGETPPLRKNTVGHMIAYFKYQTSKEINQLRNSPGDSVWQRNYFERIIRNEKELMNIREYIRNNPQQWEMDKENPGNLKK